MIKSYYISATVEEMLILYLFSILMYCTLCFGAPTFTAKISDKPVIEGRRVLWNCAVNDLETNQELLWSGYDKTNNKITQSFDKNSLQATLIFESVSRQDEGTYRCVVKFKANDDVIVASNSAKLLVTKVPSPSYPVCYPSTIHYRKGEEADISCCSEITEPTVNFKWRRNGLPGLLVGDPLRNKKNTICSHYKFDVSLDHDQTVFNCTIASENLLKPRSCTVGPLDVQYKPIVSIPSHNITIGSKAIIMCNAEANPNVIRYFWKAVPYFDYNLIGNSKVMEIDNPNLKLNGTVITCFAENKIGSSSSTFVVNLSGDVFSENANVPTGEQHASGSSASVMSTVLLIAGSCTMIALLLMILPLCYCFFSPRHNLDYFGRFVPQPDVYFQPKELETTERETPARHVWKRSCGVQVPEDISFYAELPCGVGGDDDFVDKV